jgi:hypothetical protein
MLWTKIRQKGPVGAAKAMFYRLRSVYRKIILIVDNPDAFLGKVDGIIHVGANVGQERDLYAKRKLSVLWVEPLPDVFENLCNNMQRFPQQMAVNHLVRTRMMSNIFSTFPTMTVRRRRSLTLPIMSIFSPTFTICMT